MNHFPILSFTIFVPLLGALALTLLPNLNEKALKQVGLYLSLSTLLFVVLLLRQFDPTQSGYAITEKYAWIPSLKVNFSLGLDGISLLLIGLTALISPLCILTLPKTNTNSRLYILLFLILQSAALGVFLTLDFIPWFLFWELSLVPSYFLIKLWGGSNAAKAAYQFVIYTMGGSAFMLLAFAGIYFKTGTFNFVELTELAKSGGLTLSLASLGHTWTVIVFLGVFIGLAVKVPLYPFHTWLPLAYSEAPTGASIFMTAVMSKMGVYGFIRILWPLFPTLLHRASGFLVWLALAGVVLGAFAAIRQTDIKRMLGYSSINHLSYCLLALFSISSITPESAMGYAPITAAFAGLLLQLFNHGLSAAALFYCVGFIESQLSTRSITEIGGIRKIAPRLAGFSGVALFCSLGLPGLSGFIGEFLIFKGVWGIHPIISTIACLGLFATAYFLLTIWQNVFHGATTENVKSTLKDFTASDVLTLAPITLLMILLGILPSILIQLFNPLIQHWASSLVLP